jgi:hypothetical protein
MRRVITYFIAGCATITCILIINGLVGLLVSKAAPTYHENMREINVYAYRDWQSVGIQLNQGDDLDIWAEGSWLYTPGEYHGPEGHPRYPAPSFYPIPRGTGGTLIGRIGEEGMPFLVGRHSHMQIDRDGLLYLRINDDILSDNRGSILVEVVVIPTDPEYR